MAKLVRRKKKKFKCGLCECTGDNVLPSEFSLRTDGVHLALCTKCADTLRFSSVGKYEVIGYEIRAK
jgi:hypothetical protein